MDIFPDLVNRKYRACSARSTGPGSIGLVAYFGPAKLVNSAREAGAASGLLAATASAVVLQDGQTHTIPFQAREPQTTATRC